MGSLAKQAPEPVTNKACSIIERAEDDADRAAIRKVMADPQISNRRISLWVGCSSSTVGEHRRNGCPVCCGGAA